MLLWLLFLFSWVSEVVVYVVVVVVAVSWVSEVVVHFVDYVVGKQ